MVGTYIDCCTSNCEHASIIPNVSRSADAQPDSRVMTHVNKISVGWGLMGATSDREYVSLALAAPGVRRLETPRRTGSVCFADERKIQLRDLEPW